MCDVPQTERIALRLNIATQLDHQFNKVPQIKSTSWRPSPWTVLGPGTEDVYRAMAPDEGDKEFRRM